MPDDETKGLWWRVDDIHRTSDLEDDILSETFTLMHNQNNTGLVFEAQGNDEFRGVSVDLIIPVGEGCISIPWDRRDYKNRTSKDIRDELLNEMKWLDVVATMLQDVKDTVQMNIRNLEDDE